MAGNPMEHKHPPIIRLQAGGTRPTTSTKAALSERTIKIVIEEPGGAGLHQCNVLVRIRPMTTSPRAITDQDVPAQRARGLSRVYCFPATERLASRQDHGTVNSPRHQCTDVHYWHPC